MSALRERAIYQRLALVLHRQSHGLEAGGAPPLIAVRLVDYAGQPIGRIKSNCMQPPTTSGTAGKIFLSVEDDPAAYLLLELCLKEVCDRFCLYRVADGDEALRFLRRSGHYNNAPKPDLILLDLNMPRVSGIQVLEAMNADPNLKGILTVVLSSSKLEKDRQTCLSLGAREYVVKPSDLESFLKVVENVCDLA